MASAKKERRKEKKEPFGCTFRTVGSASVSLPSQMTGHWVPSDAAVSETMGDSNPHLSQQWNTVPCTPALSAQHRLTWFHNAACVVTRAPSCSL